MQQHLPSITVFGLLLNLIPARPAQIFLFSLNSSPSLNLWSASLFFAFRGPGKSNSAVVIFLTPENMGIPSPSSDLHSF